MKNKNILTRLISLAVILFMLILSIITVSAEDWTAPKIPFTPLKSSSSFKDKDAKELAEALSEANFLCNIFTLEDYKKTDPDFVTDPHINNVKYVELAHVEYNFIKEKDYDVRRVDLKYGYYIDIVSVSQQNNGVSSAYIRNKNGYVIAEITLTADFICDGKTVKSASQKIAGKSYVSQITFADKYSKGGAERSNITFTDSAVTMKIKNSKGTEIGKYRYNAQITCDIYGNTVSYFSLEKPCKSYYDDTIGFDNPQGMQIFLKDSTKFTDKDASKLAEALSSIDYGKYELIRGSNYDIKRIYLKYGYYIEIVFESGNDNIKSDNRYNTTRDGYFMTSAMLRVHVCDSNGYIIANMQLSGNFSPVLTDEPKEESVYIFSTNANDPGKKTKSTAGIFYQFSYANTADRISQITVSGKSRGIENATDSSSIIDGIFTLNIKSGAKIKSFTFNMQIECYFNGISTAWVK